MAESTNLKTKEDLLKEIQELRKKVDDREKDSKKTTKTRTQNNEDFDVTSATFRLLSDFAPQVLNSMTILQESLEKSLEKLNEKVTILQAEIITVRDENKRLKKCLMDVEIQRSQKSVIIRNLMPLKGGEKEETPLDLRNNLQKLLKKLDIADNCWVDDVYRLKSKEPQNIIRGRSLFSPVKVDFISKQDKFLFMSKLKNLKNSPFGTLRIGQSVVQMLKKEYNELDKVAFDLRTDTPGTKTKIFIKDYKYCLAAKKPNEREFQLLEQSF